MLIRLLRLLRPHISLYKHSSGAGKVCIYAGEVHLNTSPAPQKYFYIYLSDTSPAPKKPGKYLYTPFQRLRIIIYTHFSGAAEKPEEYLYTPVSGLRFYNQNDKTFVAIIFQTIDFLIKSIAF